MERESFINHFKNKYNNQFSDYYYSLFFDIDLEDFDNKKNLSALYLTNKLLEDFEFLHIKDFIIPKDLIKVDFDYDYNEDESNKSPLIRHNVNFNLNILYDYIINKYPDLNNNNTTIYRIEHFNGTGLYDGSGFSIMSKAANKYDSQPCPSTEKAFMSIFDFHNRYIDSSYKKEWSFCFSDLNQLNKWCHSKEVLTELKENGYSINEIIIPENFVIKGLNQSIFKKDKIIYQKNLNDQKFRLKF